jgi:NAD(P)-dependent dehydrogenase (short-subunit alcohol dehydrogenase family)
MARMQDKVALITGGESAIGLSTARLFVSEGAKVHLVGIDGAKLKVAADELGDENALASLARRHGRGRGQSGHRRRGGSLRALRRPLQQRRHQRRGRADRRLPVG